jgi:hypothetical protein
MSTYDFEPNPDHYGPEPTHIANGIHKKNLLVAPPKREWVGLSEEETEAIVDAHTSDDGQGYDIWCDGRGVAAAVAAKLKEKNT